MEALGEVAVEGAEVVELGGGLDAFGDDLESEGVGRSMTTRKQHLDALPDQRRAVVEPGRGRAEEDIRRLAPEPADFTVAGEHPEVAHPRSPPAQAWENQAAILSHSSGWTRAR